jgi:hypothetical protein
MAHVQAAFFADMAKDDANGKVSMLGAFLDSLRPPSLPFNVRLSFVVRLAFDSAELTTPHTLHASLETSSGDESLFSETMPLPAMPNADFDKDLPVGINLNIELNVAIRRAGLYRMILRLDGDEVVSLPLKVQPQMPTL